MVQWDRGKATENLRKHHVDFADAAVVLEDELALTIRDPDDSDEDRWVTLGMDLLGRVLVVAYTWRDDEPRLISARRATKGERQRYEAKR